ncbi:Smr/MutS family endonuclease [Gammaproteobacteria bacterium]|nr:Smr/MutS family endonuclease [Gammaproteobacteria bacterium]
MSKKKDPIINENNIFSDAMRGIKKISYTKITPPKDKIERKIQKKHADNNEDDNLNNFQFSDYEKTQPINSEDCIQFNKSGLQNKTIRNLKNGKYNIEAKLDLHNMTTEEAKNSLSNFLTNCINNNIRYALVIHGKGKSNTKPILKNKINNWLRQTNQVLAFCTAISKHGGTGAVYLLLRKQN